MRLFNSIGKKLLWGIALPGLCVSLAGIGWLWKRTEATVQNTGRDEAESIASMLASTFAFTAPGADVGGRQTHQASQLALSADWQLYRHVEELRVIDREGIIRWSRNPGEVGRHYPDAPRLWATGPRSPSSASGQMVEVVRGLGGESCAGCHEVTAEKVGVLQLTLRRPRLALEVSGAFEGSLYGVVAFSAVLALASALSLHFFLYGPLRRLAALMYRAEEGDFLVRADADRDDEIGRLSLAFNRMLARITSMKAEEIDTQRHLALAEEQIALKEALEVKSGLLEKRVTELSLLYEFSGTLAATLELTELLSRICRLAAERLTIDQFSVMLATPDGRLEVKAAYPAGEGTEGLAFRIGEGVCGRAAQTMKAVYLPDLEADAEVYVRRSGADAKRGSLLALPMIHSGHLLGVLNLQRPERDAFSPAEVDFLKAVADQAALAVQNALLHEETVTLSRTDPLTGVPNRRHLFEQLQVEWDRANRYGGPLSILMVDIDSFKHLNDTAGHLAGDDVLREVAQLIAKRVRRVDTLGRYGGEEFMLLLPQLGRADAMEVGEKIRRTVEEVAFQYGASQPLGKVTLSVGVASYPQDAITLDQLLDSVDSALYASKRGGRNRTTAFEAGMETHPGRERGPYAAKRKVTKEFPAV